MPPAKAGTDQKAKIIVPFSPTVLMGRSLVSIVHSVKQSSRVKHTFPVRIPGSRAEPVAA